MISFQNVTWSYQEDGEGKNLNSIQLEIKDGECILLCGKSGCGKTTMTRLLNGIIPNFYEGNLQGAVLLDGKNFFDFPMHEISKQVGSVFQIKELRKEDVFLFIITHDYELIASACDSVIHIEDGQVREQYLLDDAGIIKLRDFFSGCYS